MPYLLNVVYVVLLLLASPWLLYAAWRKGKYRQGFAAKFLGLAPRRDSQRPCIWLHAVSVGEVNLLAPLLAEWTRRHPDCDCAISTTTATGYALAKKKYARHVVFYCPLDFSWAVRTAMRRIRPTLLVLAELELWPNLIRAAGEAGAKIAIVNGRLSARSFRGYRRLKPLVSRLLLQIDLIAVQTPEYAARFRELEAPTGRLHVTGSIKFDGAQTDRNNPATRRLAELAGFDSGDVVFLAGSTGAPEESVAIDAFRALQAEYPQLRLVLAPRHPDRFDAVAGLLEEAGIPWRRRTQLGPGVQADVPPVLLVDTIGELAAWWGTAQIAFVGGSLGKRGGQNMIEPAGYGAAIAFGPNTQNFRDVVAALLDCDAAVVIRSGEELTAFVRRMLADPEEVNQLGRRAQALVISQAGATVRTVDCLDELLPQKSLPPAPHMQMVLTAAADAAFGAGL